MEQAWKYLSGKKLYIAVVLYVLLEISGQKEWINPANVAEIGDPIVQGLVALGLVHRVDKWIRKQPD